MQKNNKWSENETRRLKIAYHMGADYDLMAHVLKRTKTAINKHLNRSGIRPLGTKAPSKVFHLTPHKLWEEIKRQEAENPYHSYVTEKIKIPVYMKHEKSRPLTLYDDMIFCLTLKKPINYLMDMGYNIKKASSKWSEYLVNSRFFSSQQLLILANRNRCDRGLKPFIVADLII